MFALLKGQPRPWHIAQPQLSPDTSVFVLQLVGGVRLQTGTCGLCGLEDYAVQRLTSREDKTSKHHRGHRSV